MKDRKAKIAGKKYTSTVTFQSGSIFLILNSATKPIRILAIISVSMLTLKKLTHTSHAIVNEVIYTILR
jgi:hypothetical protein